MTHVVIEDLIFKQGNVEHISLNSKLNFHHPNRYDVLSVIKEITVFLTTLECFPLMLK